MEIIYRTFDGKEFDNEEDACYHERVINDNIVMINRDGNRVYRTEGAFVLWLKDEEASNAFFDLAEAQGDDSIQGLVKGEDYGLFYWDELGESYHWVDNEIITALTRAQDIIQEKGNSIN